MSEAASSQSAVSDPEISQPEISLPAMSPGHRSRLARLHALTGAVPLAGFLLLHLVTQASALGGWQRHRGVSRFIDAVPGVLALEILCVYLPLVTHVVLGLARTSGSEKPSSVGWVGRAGRTLQQASGAILLAFLCFHGWQFRWRLWAGEIAPADMFPELCASLSSTSFGGVPVIAVAYLVGIAAGSLHAAQGVYHVCCEWHMVSPERQSFLGRLCVAGGTGLFLLGASIVIELATGSVVIRL